MKDQAEQLRNRIRMERQRTARTIAVASGKGGVGKSNFSLNFSIILSKKGKRVLLFDMDIGMGNIDILMGRITRSTMADYLQGGLSLKELITAGPEGISFISGGSGAGDLLAIKDRRYERFLDELSALQNEYDYILFDMGAGVSDAMARFILCADEIVIVTTPEPTSIMDAYSMIKFIHIRNSEVPVFLVCNRTMNDQQGKDAEWRLKETLKRFMRKEIVTLGFLPDSKAVLKAVASQIPFTVQKPNSDISIRLERLASNYLLHSHPVHADGKQTFAEKLKTFFGGRKHADE